MTSVLFTFQVEVLCVWSSARCIFYLVIIETSDHKRKAFPVLNWFFLPVPGRHSAVESYLCDPVWISFLCSALLLYINSHFRKLQPGVLFISCGICKRCWNFLTLNSYWVYCITGIWSLSELSIFSSGLHHVSMINLCPFLTKTKNLFA